ncbi:MAG: hypothetical protein KatS3mg003_0431 [Candidatus Nitrosocaldaceae archaeon]|nr:MAG: hypothetical protein KatS3mg003_0431 [Candidatus Nitrosocaldaceae archaeon]
MANIPAELAALPMDVLIGAPLEAAIKAQAQAAMTTVDFIQDVGLDGDDVKNVTFKFKRKVIDPNTGDITDEDTSLEVPFLTILPIPYIRIKDMTIHFNFTIKTSTSKDVSHKFNISTEAKAKWFFGSAKMNASYGFKKQVRSTVDRSAELDITVNAVQDEMPEGLRTTLSLLKEAIAPPASGGG